MAFRTPRDEREWRAAVERGLREARSGIRPLVLSAVDGAVGGIVEQIDQIGQGSTLRPTAPIELTWQTALYLDSEGRYKVRFMLDFPNVTKSTTAVDIQVGQYELWGRPVSAPLLALTTDAVAGLAAPGATLPGLAATPANRALADVTHPWSLRATSGESYFRADGYEPGSLWNFRARAIGTGMATPGEWSAEITVQMLEDNTPPSQPTPPTLTVARGTITATWDGQAVTGAMPADFRYAILAHGTDSSPTKEIARFGRGGGFKVVADIPYYDPQFFRLKAVDESGNESPWSEQAVGYTTPLVDKDVILSTIDAAKTHLKNIDAGVSILPNSIITEHLVVTEEMTAALANFLHVKADMIDVNDLWADTAFFGLADAVLFRGDAFEGKSFTGGTFTGPLFQTDVEDLTGIKFDAGGIRAWNQGGEMTLDIDADTGNVEILGTFQIGRVDEPYVLLDKNIWSVWPGIRFKTQDSTLAFQPSIFAIGDGSESGWGAGDLVVMGSQQVANNTPRSQLRLGGTGSVVSLGRSYASHNVNNVDNEIRFMPDGSTAIRGHANGSLLGSLFRHGGTAQTGAAAGYWDIPLNPPPYGAYWPSITADGLGVVNHSMQSLNANGFRINFSGPANNLTSFHYLLHWRL